MQSYIRGADKTEKATWGQCRKPCKIAIIKFCRDTGERCWDGNFPNRRQVRVAESELSHHDLLWRGQTPARSTTRRLGRPFSVPPATSSDCHFSMSSHLYSPPAFESPPPNRLNSSSQHGLVAIEFLRDVPSPEVAILFLATSPSFGMTLRNLFAHLTQGFLIIFVRAATFSSSPQLYFSFF